MKILITGASSGIGKSLAYLAASRQMDLILVARREGKLEELKSELQTKHDIDVEIIKADLTIKDDLEIVKNRITKGDISIVVNNAGFGTSGPFVELDLDTQQNEIDLNIKALVDLTYLAANQMVEQGRGTIVNISSIAGYLPMVGNAVYGATKAFVTTFSHAIKEELKNTGVKVLVVCPGMTKTEFQSRSRWTQASNNKPLPSIVWQSPDEVALSVFLAIDKQKAVVIPGVVNKVFASFASTVPFNMTRKITAVIAKGRRMR